MNKKRSIKRKTRIRAKIRGSHERPRLSVHKTSRYLYAQLIDDEKAKTLLGYSEKHLSNDELKGMKTERARKLGVFLAKKALEKKIKKVVFDRGQYVYHGRVKAFAEGARAGGLQF